MNSVIVGTAGHIDHGKTSLIKALTGYDTDTLEEEKKRGITINLGFTSFKLPSGRTLGIVDVPGHEKFIKNMLAGATGVDVALIVISATEGIMPQTEEHIDILSYLGIQKSLFVLTKIDLVEEEFKELVIEDIKSYAKGTFLEGTKIVEVDAISKRGIDSLIKDLEDLTADVKQRSFAKKPRMNVDRVFSIKGHGTVVTGTLIEGMIRVEDELMVYPSNICTKVRNLQVHDKNVDCAYAGQRTAINLSNLSVEEVYRGCTVAEKDSVYITDIIDVKFSIVKNTKFEMGKHYQLKIYVGASEEVVKFIPITHKKVKAGDEGYAQILLENKITVLKGDRFVLRTISPVTTVGGGVVVDPKPIKYKKITEDIIKIIQSKDSNSIEEIIETFIKSNPFATKVDIATFVNEQLNDDVLTQFVNNKLILNFDDKYIHIEYLIHFKYNIEVHLKEYHNTNPLRIGMSKAELFEKLNIDNKKNFEYLIQSLIDDRFIKVEQNYVLLYDFCPSLTGDQLKIKNELEDKVVKSGFILQTVKDLVENDKNKQQVLEFLMRSQFIALSGNHILDKHLYLNAKDVAKSLFNEKGTIKLSDFRDKIGASRKYALIILEKFDQENFTCRQGEDRILY